MRAAVLRHVPTASRPWVEELLADSDPTTLASFLHWHGPHALRSVFAWTPPWSPPPWRTFIQHGIPDWNAVRARFTNYISNCSLAQLRSHALNICSSGDPAQVALEIGAWISDRICWVADWGMVSPLEILQRGEGSSLHQVQLCVGLLRSLFLPARIVEELACVPSIWVAQAKDIWNQAPASERRWCGERVFYHPFCEARVGRRWLPMDPQRAQFGLQDLRMHLQVPELLKLKVRAARDYGRSIDRGRQYLLAPLDKASLSEQNHLREEFVWAHSLVPHGLAVSASNFDGQGERLRKLQADVSRAWASGREAWQLHPESGAAAPCLRAVLDGPIRSGSQVPSTAGRHVLAGLAMRHAGSDAWRRAVVQGAQVIAVFEPWGEGEAWARALLAQLSMDFGPWLVPLGMQAPPVLVHLSDRGDQPLILGNMLDVRLLRALRGAPAAALRTADGRVVAAEVRQGRGRWLLLPEVLLQRADPYRTDLIAGHHRCALRALLRPTRDTPELS